MAEGETIERETADSPVKTIGRAAKILTILAGAEASGMMLTEIARQAEFGKGTTHRLLAALVDAGFVFQDTENRRYRLGVQLGLFAHRSQAQNLAFLAQPILEKLALETGDTAFCSVREGLHAVCIARAIGPFPIRTLTLDIGHRRPLGVGAGSLALLAALPPAVIDDMIAKNAAAIAAHPTLAGNALPMMVAEARRYGYALNDANIIPGMSAVGYAVRGKDGGPIASLSIASIRERVQGPRIIELAGLLKQAATDLAALV
ncbi:MAG TPA: IclR family transcriptional regulator [Stellaceae bacterium]|nr:IclR family transcriptional regulator [Stellaceae bacterium]